MALPVLLQKLFDNAGVGPLLRSDILPASVVQTTAQSFTDEEKTQARTNIGALGTDETAASATKLATARTIALTGEATGSGSFDGSADAALNVTISEGAVTFEKVNSDAVATQAEAEAGTANNSFMTPLRVAQAIAAQSSSGGAYITEIYHSGANWYRVWSDGFIEQGGKSTVSAYVQTLSLLRWFSSTDYTVLITQASTYTGNRTNDSWVIQDSQTTTSFEVRNGYTDYSATLGWVAYGY